MATKPDNPAIQASHPLAVGLIAHFDSKNQQSVKPAGNVAWTTAGTNYGAVATPGGMGVTNQLNSGAAASGYAKTNVDPGTLSGGFTLAGRVWVKQTPLSNTIYGTREGGSGSPLQFCKFHDTGSLYSNGLKASHGNVGPTYPRWFDAALVWDSTTGTCYGYLDGAWSIGSALGVATFRPGPVGIMADGTGNEPISARTPAIFETGDVWGRALSLTELQAYFTDPWAHVRPSTSKPWLYTRRNRLIGGGLI